MSEWEETMLGALCAEGALQTGPFGSQLHAHDYQDEGIPVVMPQDLVDGRVSETSIARITEADAERLSRHRLRPGDIVYSRRGDVTRKAWVSQREQGWLCGTGCLLVRVGSEAHSRWLSYWLSAPWTRAWIIRHAVGATMPNLNTGILGAVPVSLPPMDEQRRIAAVLGAFDDLIETHRVLINRSIELAKHAIFRSVADGAQVRVSDVAHVRRGLSYKGAGLADEGIPMVNMGSAAFHGWLKRDGWKFYQGEYKPRHVARAGDLILTNTEQTWRQEILGWPMLVPADEAEVLFTHHTYLVDFPPQDRWMRLALWAQLYTPQLRAEIDGSVRGTTVANLPIDAVEQLQFRVPKAGSDGVREAETLLNAVWADELAIADLTRQREELLPLLMSGRVRVEDVEGVA